MSDFTVRNFVVGPNAPTAPQGGDMWYNTGTTSLLEYSGSGWIGVMPEYVQDVQNQVAAATYAVSHPIFVAPNTGETWQVKAVTAGVGTHSTSGTLQVEVAASGTAIAGGTNQLTGAISLSGADNTAVNGVVIASPTLIVAGSRINLIFAGTVTSLLNFVCTVALTKLS